MRIDITVVAAEVRTSRGKNEARRTRVRGQIPASFTAHSRIPSRSRQSPRDHPKIIRSNTGYNTIFNAGNRRRRDHPVMVVDQQVDPIKGTLLHVDLKRIDLTKRIRVTVPVHDRRRSEGREGAGRLARSGHPRHRNRVPAGRHSGAVHGRRHRIDDRPEPSAPAMSR